MLKEHLKSKILRFRVGINLSINDLSNTFNFTNTDLIKAGFDTTEFKNAKIPLNIGDLLDLDFNAERFKKEEIAIKDIVEFVMNHKKEVNLKKLGYTLDDLYSVHIIDRSILQQFGFDSVSISNFRDELSKKISEQKKTTQQNLKILGYNALVLKKLLYNSSQLKAEGFSVIDLKQAGFTPFELRQAGFTAFELKDAGYTVAEFKKSYYIAEELKDAGFSAKELKDAGFTVFELRQAGFTAFELKDAGYTAAEFKQGYFSAKELKDARFSAKELNDAGFSADGLVIAGFNITEITEAGFNIKNITIPENVISTIIPEINYDVDNLIKKFNITQLKGFGISVKQFKDIKTSVLKLIQAGFTAEELKKEGYNVEQFKQATFDAKQLKDLGFGINDLHGKFKPQQLKDAGFDFAALNRIGITAEAYENLKKRYMIKYY